MARSKPSVSFTHVVQGITVLEYTAADHHKAIPSQVKLLVYNIKVQLHIQVNDMYDYECCTPCYKTASAQAAIGFLLDTRTVYMTMCDVHCPLSNYSIL